jgi:peroxiredoxin Q/BCP
MNDTKIVPVGRPAPAFTAPDDRGQQVSLADYKGRYVVLFFYPKDDTAG